MVRASQSEKQATHERIVAEAARQIRERGTRQPGIAEIMGAAGLTHGGFYKHFASRDELIAAAAEQAMRAAEPVVAASLAAEDPLAAFTDWYVSSAHRDDPGDGCGVAALAGDAARDGAVRGAYRAQVARYLELLQEMLGDEDPARRQRAAVTLSALVGAVVIARALGDTPTSDALLADVGDAVRERRLLPAD
ncbi:TetR family transcriptional regulator [Planotetraspora thailandica]|uniref:TetR family transcriptional regulator n=1 Tax=Planotetraspora thailandica TaxID=487172 RepID=A0A8J3XYK5_9ACTN|nr:TetR/AcrR family transcriptional regulator [Planotetraspora thailandica]GII57351.1 TetR family transcriptional regulator [Planotetraspora thailandica]